MSIKPTPSAEAKAPEKAKAAEKAPWEAKPVPPAPEDASGDQDVTALDAGVEEAVLRSELFAEQVTVTVAREKIVEVCRFLKDELKFTFLVDLTAIDWPQREDGRFDLVYWMHRFDDQKRLRLIATVAEDQAIASVTGVWKTANWLEREVYDMFGIDFADHPNLERILTWEGFNGHPLRKDFPIIGVDTGAAIYPEVYPAGGGPAGAEEGGKK